MFFDDVAASLKAARSVGMITVGINEPLSSQIPKEMIKYSDILVDDLSPDIFDKIISL